MSVLQKSFHNSQVFYDSVLTHRWYDAIGPNVRKWFLVDNYNAGAATETAVSAGAGTSNIAGLTSSLGGGLLFTCAGNENDGIQTQHNSEMNYFNGPFPFYFGARFMANDVDQVDAFLGCAIADTSIIAGCTDDIGFRTVDETASLTFLIEKNNLETEVAVHTLVDDTYVTVEFVYDGTTVTYYVNDVEVGSVAVTATNFPNDEHLAPALAILTGEATANTMTVQWARWIQILE